MLTFIAIIHVIAAILIVALVLLQDSKGNGAFGMGGSGSQSLFGATGAQSLAAKITVYVGIVFAITSVSLSYYSSTKNKSVIDEMSLPEAPTPTAPAAEPTEAPAATPAAPATAEPPPETQPTPQNSTTK